MRRANEEDKYLPTQTSASRARQAGRRCGGGGRVREASSRAISHKATGPCTSQAQKAPRFWMLLVHMARSQAEKVKS